MPSEVVQTYTWEDVVEFMSIAHDKERARAIEILEHTRDHRRPTYAAGPQERHTDDGRWQACNEALKLIRSGGRP